MVIRKLVLSATAASLVVSCISATLPAQERQSLKDAARASGGKTQKLVMLNMPFVPLTRVSEESDMVLQGRVRHTETRLSDDEESVLTYVTLTPTHFFKGSGRSANTTVRPGAVPSVVFVQLGGTVKIDGLEITHREQIGIDPPLQVGEDVIAFLGKGDDEPDVYKLTHGAYSLLRVQGDKVAAGSKRVEKTRPLESDRLSDVQTAIRNAVGSAKR